MRTLNRAASEVLVAPRRPGRDGRDRLRAAGPRPRDGAGVRRALRLRRGRAAGARRARWTSREAGVETGGAAHNRRFVAPALTVADGVDPRARHARPRPADPRRAARRGARRPRSTTSRVPSAPRASRRGASAASQAGRAERRADLKPVPCRGPGVRRRPVCRIWTDRAEAVRRPRRRGPDIDRRCSARDTAASSASICIAWRSAAIGRIERRDRSGSKTVAAGLDDRARASTRRAGARDTAASEALHLHLLSIGPASAETETCASSATLRRRAVGRRDARSAATGVARSEVAPWTLERPSRRRIGDRRSIPGTSWRHARACRRVAREVAADRYRSSVDRQARAAAASRRSRHDVAIIEAATSPSMLRRRGSAHRPLVASRPEPGRARPDADARDRDDARRRASGRGVRIGWRVLTAAPDATRDAGLRCVAGSAVACHRRCAVGADEDRRRPRVDDGTTVVGRAVGPGARSRSAGVPAP